MFKLVKLFTFFLQLENFLNMDLENPMYGQGMSAAQKKMAKVRAAKKTGGTMMDNAGGQKKKHQTKEKMTRSDLKALFKPAKVKRAIKYSQSIDRVAKGGKKGGIVTPYVGGKIGMARKAMMTAMKHMEDMMQHAKPAMKAEGNKKKGGALMVPGPLL